MCAPLLRGGGGGGNSTQIRSSDLDARLNTPYTLTSSNPANLREKSLLIIAVPSEDSFLRYVVNGILNMPPHHISRFSDKTLAHIAKIFGLHLVAIYHEQVQPYHKDFYTITQLSKYLMPTPLIDKGYPRKIITKLLRYISPLLHIPHSAYGHTVIAVYEIP